MCERIKSFFINFIDLKKINTYIDGLEDHLKEKKKDCDNILINKNLINFTWNINQMTFIIITNIDMTRVAFVSLILHKYIIIIFADRLFNTF